MSNDNSIPQPASQQQTTRGLVGQLAAVVSSRLILNTARRMLYAFAPAFGRGLGVPLTSITPVIAIHQAAGLTGPIFGPLGDRWGYRLMMLIGLGLLGVGLLAGGFFPYYTVILIAFLLAGLAKAIFDPVIQAYVGERVPYERRGLAIGVIEFAWAGSSLIGVPLVGLLIQRLGWRSPFFILGGLSLLGLVGLRIVIPDDRRRPGAGSSLSGLVVAWRQLITHRLALGALAFTFLISAANDILFVIYGVWLESSFGLTVLAVGGVTTVIGIAELMGEGLTASLADRVGLKRGLLVGLGLSTLSYLLLPVIAHSLASALGGIFFIFVTLEFTIVTSLSLFTEILPGARATMLATNIASAGAGRMVGAIIGGFVWLSGGLPATGLAAALASGLAFVCLVWGLRGWRA